MPQIKHFEPKDYNPQTTTVWEFPYRGNWATHEGSFRGNFSPYVPRNLLDKYTEEGDLILDPFLGGGTTSIEAKIMGRDVIGIDINPKFVADAKLKVNFHYKDTEGKTYFKVGDARDMPYIPDASIDMIITQPPCADLLQYSSAGKIPGDLSLMNPDDFITELHKVAAECFRVVKSNKYCAVAMSDIRRNGLIIPMGARVMNCFLEKGFVLRDNIVKIQHGCRDANDWGVKDNKFYLLMHEYIFVFKKPWQDNNQN